MKKEVAVYLEDILESADKIIEYAANITLAGFRKNAERQDAVMRRLEIIGEAVKNMPADFRVKHGEVPWKQIAGLRDVLIHEYSGVRLERVWRVVKDDIPKLRRSVLKIKDDLKTNG